MYDLFPHRPDLRVPDMKDRAFYGINSSVHSWVGDASVVGAAHRPGCCGRLLHYDVLGYVTIGAFLLCIVLMYYVNSYMMEKSRGSSESDLCGGA